MEVDAGGGGAAHQLSCFKISKRGRVRKVVREVYLRDDLPCGIKGCYLCGDPTKGTGTHRRLGDNGILSQLLSSCIPFFLVWRVLHEQYYCWMLCCLREPTG